MILTFWFKFMLSFARKLATGLQCRCQITSLKKQYSKDKQYQKGIIKNIKLVDHFVNSYELFTCICF